MSEILKSEKNYKEALELYVCSIYAVCYEYEYTSKQIDIIKVHFNNRRQKMLTDLMKKTNLNTKDILNLMKKSILKYIPGFYNDEKIEYISKRIINILN